MLQMSMIFLKKILQMSVMVRLQGIRTNYEADVHIMVKTFSNKFEKRHSTSQCAVRAEMRIEQECRCILLQLTMPCLYQKNNNWLSTHEFPFTVCICSQPPVLARSCYKYDSGKSGGWCSCGWRGWCNLFKEEVISYYRDDKCEVFMEHVDSWCIMRRFR